MLAEPSKDTPWIVLAVVKVAALPVVLALIVAGNDKVIAAVSEPLPVTVISFAVPAIVAT